MCLKQVAKADKSKDEKKLDWDGWKNGVCAVWNWSKVEALAEKQGAEEFLGRGVVSMERRSACHAMALMSGVQ
jgi:hypothetical protein